MATDSDLKDLALYVGKVRDRVDALETGASAHLLANDPHGQYATEAALLDYATTNALAQAINDHAAAANPHSSYLTQSEADALYAPVGGGGSVADGSITTAKLGGDITTAGKALLDDANAAAQRVTLGLGSAATTASTDYAAAIHTHVSSDITDFASSVAAISPPSIAGMATLDFGASPTDSAVATITDAAISPTSAVNVWMQAGDSTAGNDAGQHAISAASLRFLSTPGAGSLELEAHPVFGLATGQFKVRYSFQ